MGGGHDSGWCCSCRVQGASGEALGSLVVKVVAQLLPPLRLLWH